MVEQTIHDGVEVLLNQDSATRIRAIFVSGAPAATPSDTTGDGSHGHEIQRGQRTQARATASQTATTASKPATGTTAPAATPSPISKGKGATQNSATTIGNCYNCKTPGHLAKECTAPCKHGKTCQLKADGKCTLKHD